MKHLGERITALVDGQLDHDTRDLALAHLARCPSCQAAVAAERDISSTLRNLSDATPSPDLVGTLLALAEPGGPLPPARPSFPGATKPVAGWRSTYGRSTSPAPARTPLRRRTSTRFAVASLASAGVLTAALASLGGAEPGTSVVPPMQEFTVEHARSTGMMPFSDPSTAVLRAGLPEDVGP